MSNEHLVWYIGGLCAMITTIIWSLISNQRDAIKVLEEQRKEDRRDFLALKGLVNLVPQVQEFNEKARSSARSISGSISYGNRSSPSAPPHHKMGGVVPSPPTFLSKSDLPDDTPDSAVHSTTDATFDAAWGRNEGFKEAMKLCHDKGWITSRDNIKELVDKAIHDFFKNKARLVVSPDGRQFEWSLQETVRHQVEKHVELQMRGLVDQVIAVRNTHKQITWDINGIQERLDRLEVFTGTEAGHKDQDDEFIGHS